jgi:ADP-heptose:LPS heptosyltransferase
MKSDGRFTNLRKFLNKNNLKIFDENVDKNQNIIFIGEGGIGDEFIFSRFGKKLRELGYKSTYISLNNLSHVIKTSNYFDKCYNFETNKSKSFYDYNTEYNQKIIKQFKYFISPWTSYLKYESNTIFNFQKDCIWEKLYIKTQSNFDDKWKKIIQTNKIRIGIKFSGTPSLENEYKRAIPFEKIYELFDPDKYQLYSFQKDECVEIVKEYEDVIDLSDKFNDWNDTLSALNQMDFVISSCTSVGHAAATLNKNTFILIPNNKYTYRLWHDCNENNEKSQWYSEKVRILKQKSENDWSYPIERLKTLMNLTVTNKKLNYDYS